MRWAIALVSILSASFATAHTATIPKVQRFELNGNQYRALSVHPAHVSLHWKNSEDKPYRNMGRLKTELKQQGKDILAIMNAGIYSANDTPAGLHIENGNTIKSLNTRNGKGNFHLQPNGVFLINHKHKAKILTTRQYQRKYASNKQTARLQLATQSGPMLLINGKINPKFIPDSSSIYSRNGVCTTPKGQLFFLITDNFPTVKVNLYQFALAAKKLGCNNALYLDGSISKLYAKGGASFHFGHFVGMLAVTNEKD